jgi:hypothetical protein
VSAERKTYMSVSWGGMGDETLERLFVRVARLEKWARQLAPPELLELCETKGCSNIVEWDQVFCRSCLDAHSREASAAKQGSG